jgi:hypothetical protein
MSTQPTRKLRPRRSPRPVESFNAKRPFTRGEAIQAGISEWTLRGVGYRRLLPNVYVEADVPVTPGLAAVAPLAVAVGTAWVSHLSAARVYGAPVPAVAGQHISVVSEGDRLRRAGVTSHVAPTTSRIVNIDGYRISAPVQLFVELAEQLTLVDLVVVGDWLVRKKRVTLERLREFSAQSRLPGAVAARAAASLVRESVDSPMETRVRLLLLFAGFPEPKVNMVISGVEGQPRRRFDLCWPGVKVIVEYDGRHHVEREEQWESDLARREEIDDGEWRLIVLVAKDVYKRPDLALRRIERLLREKGLPGLPARLSDSWRAHFPVVTGYL